MNKACRVRVYSILFAPKRCNKLMKMQFNFLISWHRQPIQNLFVAVACNRTGLHDFDGLANLFLQLLVLQYEQSFVAHLPIRQVHFGENKKDFRGLQARIGQQCVQQNAYEGKRKATLVTNRERSVHELTSCRYLT